MEISRFYNKYWSAKRRKDTLLEYERNWVLPAIFENKKGKVLDLACGDGAVSEFLMAKGFDVIGADFSKTALGKAKERGIKTEQVNAEGRLPFKSGNFDLVFWGDNVEHLFDPQATLKEIKRVLKKNGKLILSCPNMGYWRYRLHYLFKGNLADSEWSGNPPWRWLHIRFFDFKTVKDFLATEGFLAGKFWGVSRRLPDRFLRNIFPSIFGMIMVVEADKK